MGGKRLLFVTQLLFIVKLKIMHAHVYIIITYVIGTTQQTVYNNGLLWLTGKCLRVQQQWR